MKYIILKLVRLYQRFLSLPGICRFSPSCSEYTYQAIGRYGILYGSWKGVKRIVRCHPWNPGGYDPL